MSGLLAASQTMVADLPQLLPAREMMAFTLGFHIMLVPFGVAFTFIMLIANDRGIRLGTQTHLLLARRWSQVAAVLFAVGAVSGTVLSFEMGLLWPGLMGRFGAAYGMPFAVEGLFFFLEAIFVAMYIYGWDRMAPWPHFWTGVPVVLAGIGGTVSVVAANGWMNQPGGITLRDGTGGRRPPLEVIFNGAFWYEAIHMLIAAYMVGGIHRRRRLCGWACCDGRRDRRHRLGLAIPFTVGRCRDPGADLRRRRRRARGVPQRAGEVRLDRELVATGTQVPEKCWAEYYRERRADGSHRHPFGCVAAGRVQSCDPDPRAGRDPGAVPAAGRARDDRPPGVRRHGRDRVRPAGAVGVVRMAVVAKAGGARGRWLLRAVSVGGALSLVALWSGWVVTEVGRQPWTVVGLLLTRDAVTRAGNIWLFFAGTLLLYAVVGMATIWVLGLLRRRWARGEITEAGDAEVPYGPSKARESTPTACGWGCAMRPR